MIGHAESVRGEREQEDPDVHDVHADAHNAVIAHLDERDVRERRAREQQQDACEQQLERSAADSKPGDDRVRDDAEPGIVDAQRTAVLARERAGAGDLFGEIAPRRVAHGTSVLGVDQERPDAQEQAEARENDDGGGHELVAIPARSKRLRRETRAKPF